MLEREGYMPGVPCWVNTSQPDPEAAVAFYGGLFGWDFEDAMPLRLGRQVLHCSPSRGRRRPRRVAADRGSAGLDDDGLVDLAAARRRHGQARTMSDWAERDDVRRDIRGEAMRTLRCNLPTLARGPTTYRVFLLPDARDRRREAA